MQRVDRLPGAVEVGIGEPAGEAVVVDARARARRPACVMIMWSKTSCSVARIAAWSRIGSASLGRALVGPADVQVAAQEAIFVGHALGEPEIVGVVPEIAHAEELDGDDAGRVDAGSWMPAWTVSVCARVVACAVRLVELGAATRRARRGRRAPS